MASEDFDREVAEFILGQPRHVTYTELAERCREQFGAERAWSRTRIFVYLNKVLGVRRGKASRLDADDEVRAFVEDRLGRFTLDEIVEQSRKRFGKSRAPSRSGVQRHWERVRKRLHDP